MKYTINSYDAVKDVAVVTLKFKFKTVQQPDLVVRAHNVPVDDKESMNAWALGVVAGKKNELRSAESAKTIDPRITTEQTVSDPAE